MLRLVFIVLVATVSIAAAARPAKPLTENPSTSAVLTAEELFRPATLGRAALSPNGQRLGAIVSDDDDRRHLMIIDLKSRKPTGVRAHDNFDVNRFEWLNDDRVLFNTTRDNLYSWGLYTADADRPDRNHAINYFDVTEIVGIPRERPGHVLVWIEQAQPDGRIGPLLEFDADDHTGLHSRHRSDRGAIRTYTSPKGGSVIGWVANRRGDLGLCATSEGGRTRLHRYRSDQSTWSEVKLDLESVTPMAFDPDDRFLWVVTHHEQNGFELRRYSLDTEELAAPVLTDVEYDIGDGMLFFGQRMGELAGVVYTKRKHAATWFSPEYLAAQAAIDSAFPQTDNVLVDRDSAERRFLFQRTGAQQPGAFVLLDTESKTLSPLAIGASWLETRPLQTTQPISFRTRDDVRLEGYLTLPQAANEKRPVPLVVLVHGGPSARDTPTFDPEVQFLASRGYAVLQPNYRGSAGYAPAISREYRFDYRRMHDDVTDATHAMLRSGLVDPKRVAIMGASFGGYLAICGVAFEEDLYACAISTAGVFDWEYLIKSARRSMKRVDYEYLVEKLGKPGRDRERFEAISPLLHVDRIHVPILIGHGTEDSVVDIAQSRRLVAALKKRGVPHETFFRKLEGHGFYNYKNRVDYYHRVEAFLAANLGGISLVPVKAVGKQ